MTPSLIDAIKQAMEAQQVTRTELAKRTGTTQSGITRFLDGEQKSSALVPAICEVLQLPAPDQPLPDEVVELVKQLDDKDRDIAIAFLRRLVRPTK